MFNRHMAQGFGKPKVSKKTAGQIATLMALQFELRNTDKSEVFKAIKQSPAESMLWIKPVKVGGAVTAWDYGIETFKWSEISPGTPYLRPFCLQIQRKGKLFDVTNSLVCGVYNLNTDDLTIIDNLTGGEYARITKTPRLEFNQLDVSEEEVAAIDNLWGRCFLQIVQGCEGFDREKLDQVMGTEEFPFDPVLLK